MRTMAKPPKGGAPRPKSPLSVEQMLDDMHKYHHLMFKPGQVKSPEGMETTESFLSQLDVLKSFQDIIIKAPVFDKYQTTYSNHQSYQECMELSHDSNLMVLLECLSIATIYSDRDDPYDKGWLNILRMLVALYQGNPYTRDRIGWFMWAVGKHIHTQCYFPLALDLYYDPRLWHRPGQASKPPLPIPQSLTFDGTNQVFGPEDDIWDCELPDTG